MPYHTLPHQTPTSCAMLAELPKLNEWAAPVGSSKVMGPEGVSRLGAGACARGKALAVFPDMARGNLLQIKAAGEGYSKFSPQG